LRYASSPPVIADKTNHHNHPTLAIHMNGM
jgi:hypothetical protein